MAAAGEDGEVPYPCSHAIYMQVGYEYMSKGQFQKALNAFHEAGQATPTFNGGLVAAGQCYLKAGKPKLALQSANDALKQEPENVKAVLVKAEALYHTGEFEWALAYYHRGLKARPDVDDFKKGIQKSTKAVMNGVGDPKTIHLKVKGELAFLQQDAIAILRKAPTVKKTTTIPIGIMAAKAAMLARKPQEEKKFRDPPKTVRQLLGDLYDDKKYLEQLLNNKDTLAASSHKAELETLARDSVQFLDTQTDFWRQQKPMYTRKTDYARRHKKKDAELTSAQLTKMFLEALVDIDNALLEGRSTDALKKAEQWLQRVDKQSHLEMPGKPEILASLYSSYGNALLDLGRQEEALDAHRNDLDISRKARNVDGIGRALDNVGRSFAKLHRHKEAIKAWLEKLPMCSSMVEKTWLLHEIGRSHFDMGNFKEATQYGYRAMEAADQTTDGVWKINARVLIAQSMMKGGKKEEPDCRTMFVSALDIARDLGERVSQDAIEMALQDLNAQLHTDSSSPEPGLAQGTGFDEGERPYTLPSTGPPDPQGTVTGRAGIDHYQQVRQAGKEHEVVEASRHVDDPDPRPEVGEQPPFLDPSSGDLYRDLAVAERSVERRLQDPAPPGDEDSGPVVEEEEVRIVTPVRIGQTPLLEMPGPRREHVIDRLHGTAAKGSDGAAAAANIPRQSPPPPDLNAEGNPIKLSEEFIPG